MSWNIAKPGDQINGPVAVTGNLNVDSNTLFVDSANNRVGVLTASPTVPLDVVGDAKISGNLTVDTNTLVVDAANNRLGIGTATPRFTLDATGDIAIPLNSKFYAYYGTATNYASFGANNSGNIEFTTGTSSPAVRQTIAADGVCTWSNVVNAGTAMTLNGTGLGVGVSPSHKLHVVGTAANLVRFRSTAASGPYVIFENSSAIFGDVGSQLAISGTGSASNMLINARSTGSLMLATGDTAKLTVDSSGNVGIGTTTPAVLLEVSKNSVGEALRLTRSSDLLRSLRFVSSDNGGSGSKWSQHIDSAYGTFGWTSNSVERMVLDPSGNLGLGVTPANWSSLIGPVLQINNGSFYAYSNEIRINANFKYDGADKYISNGYATSYNQASGAHYWYSAANNTSGANAALTWGGAKMTLDASGNLLLGTASGGSARRLTVYGNSINTTATSIALQTSSTGTTSTDGLTLEVDGINGYLYNYENAPIFIGTNNTTRFTIKSTGQVNFVGLASDPAGAAAGDVYYNTTTNKLKCYNGTTWNDLF